MFAPRTRVRRSAVSGLAFRVLTLNSKLGTRNSKLLLAALLLALTQLTLSSALEVPPLRGRVNDLAGMMPASRVSALQEQLRRFEEETGHQIAVLIIPSLQGEVLEDFSIKVAETWKIGKKGFDNGAILLIAKNERKLRIEVGYGLEGILPDAIASRIIREIIVPHFRANDYAGGIEAGVEAIMKVTSGEPLPAPARTPARPGTKGPMLPVVLVLVVVLLALIVGITQRTPPRGAFGGAAAATIVTLPTAATSGSRLWPLTLVLGALLGAIGSMFASQAWGRPWSVRGSRRRDFWVSDFFSGGGGFGGGGGFSGGGDFSGGGGGFGGGGASGDW